MVSRCRWKRLRQHSGNFFDVGDAMRRQTRGQMHRSPVGHRRQQISKFLMLSLSERALSSPMWKCGRLTPRSSPSVHPQCLPACLTSTTHLPLPLHSTSISQKREESTPPRNSSLSPSLSLSLSLCPVAQSECGGRTYRKSPSLHAALTPAIGPLRKECTRKGTVVVNSCSGLNLGIGI